MISLLILMVNELSNITEKYHSNSIVLFNVNKYIFSNIKREIRLMILQARMISDPNKNHIITEDHVC